MARGIKIILKVAGVILGLCIVLWIAIVGYIHYNKKAFAELITNRINDNINGTVLIGDIQPTLVRGFPDISFKLKDFKLRDSLWEVHHKDVIDLKAAYVSVNLWAALKKEAYVKKLTLTDGNIMLYTDEDSLSNTNFTQKKKNDKKIKNPINSFALSDVTLTIIHKVKNKDFKLDVSDCDIEVQHNDTGWVANMDIRSKIKSFAFNTKKGSFIGDKLLEADIRLLFNTDKQLLTLPMQTLQLDDFGYKLGGDFNFAEKPSSFNLDIEATEVPYENILEILTPAIRSKLKKVKVGEVQEVMVKLIGKMKYRDTPYVKANFVVDNQTLNVPQGRIDGCSFNGYFLNVMEEGMGHGDRNSMIYVEQLTGSFYNMAFRMDETSLKNLASPMVETRFTSDFKVKHLNEAIGINSFRFKEGHASVRLKCKVPLNADDNRSPRIDGKVSFKATAFSYTPRRLDFTKASGAVVFDGTDVAVEDLQLSSQKNKLKLNATIDNLLSLYYTAPEKVVIECDISSKKIQLDEYTTFLAERKEDTTTDDKRQNTSESIQKFAGQLDEIMKESVVNIGVAIDEVDYKKFRADNITADIALKRKGIDLKDLQLDHAGGQLQLSAEVTSKSESSVFDMNADIQEVDAQKLFYAFNNFGQDAILDTNIRGIVSAKVNARGEVKYTGDIIKNSINGDIEYNLKDGRLIGFEPLGTIGKIIFFNRDLDDITVKPLKGKLDVNRSNITIEPVLIQTSAFNIFTEGVYGIPTGTSILIQVPLKKPKKNQKDLSVKDMKKGIVINLHATDENTGDVKIKLGKGPFK